MIIDDSIKQKYPEGEENGEQRVKQSRWDDATVNTTTDGNVYTQAKILVVLNTMRFDDRKERLTENLPSLSLEFKKNTI